MSDLYPFRDDYISTAEIGRRLGFNITAAFIKNTLGVPPSFNTRSGCYWSPEQLQRVYGKLTERIAAEAARSAPEARDHVQVTAGGDVDHSEGQGDSRGESETSSSVGVGVAVQGSGEA